MVTHCRHTDTTECVLVLPLDQERDEVLKEWFARWRALSPTDRLRSSEATRKRLDEIRARDAVEILAVIEEQKSNTAHWRTCEEARKSCSE